MEGLIHACMVYDGTSEIKFVFIFYVKVILPENAQLTTINYIILSSHAMNHHLQLTQKIINAAINSHNLECFNLHQNMNESSLCEGRGVF